MARGSSYPFTWTTGVQSLRASLYRMMMPVADLGAQVGIPNAQFDALGRGQDVKFPTPQLKSWYPGGTEHPSLPPDLDAHAFWTLSGDDTLTGSD
jgi:hypothetical protein